MSSSSSSSSRTSSNNFVGLCMATTTALFALSSTIDSAEGFSPVSKTTNVLRQNQVNSRSISSSSSPLRMASDAQAEIKKLQEMAAAARADAARLAKELGYEDEDLGTKGEPKEPPKPKRSPEEVAAAINSIDFAVGSPDAQIKTMDELKEDGSLSLYKSATMEGGSGDLRNFPVSLQMLENRSGLTSEKLGIGEEEVSLDDFKYGTLWVTGGCTLAGIASLALLPENTGATFCYIFALIPILWLGVGSTVPAAIASLILVVKGSDEGGVDPTERICRHEAAHFLVGYLCGLPVANYATAEDSDIPRVEFHYSSDPNAVATAASRELTMDEVNALTVVALSGAVAEAGSFEKAKGGNADLLELQQIFRKSEQFLGSDKQKDMTRWGALTSYRLLNTNRAKLDALTKAFSQKKSIAECVAIIEQV